MFKKIIVCIILILFFGTSFASFSCGELNNSNITELCKPSSTIDWWPMFRHDLNRSGYSSSSAPNTNDLLWNFTTSAPIDSSPAIVNGKVYFGSRDNFYCLNAVTGLKLWEYPLNYPVFSSPAFYENMIYFGSTNSSELNGNKVYCLNADTGEKIWEFTEVSSTWGAFSSPAATDDKVYFGSGDHKMYCFDAITGVKIWDYLTGDEVISSPAVVNGKVYFGSQDQFVYCLNADNGSEIWSYLTNYKITSSPVVVNGKVYIGSDKLYCLDADTGAFIWQRSPNFFLCSPAVYGDMVYACDIDDRLYCFSAENGFPQWQFNPDVGYMNTFSSPIVADGKVYFGSSDTKLYCIDAETGEEIWEYMIDYYPIFSSPAVAGGRLYIGGWSGIFLCFGQPNNPPNKPNIYGPQNGTTNINYTFCTDTITDPEGDSFYCFWDWGDGSNTGWIGPYASGQTICASHMWTEPGVYCIILKLKDAYGIEIVSDPFCITIVDNQPPSAPSIKGPSHVKIGVNVSWSFLSIDPEGGNITYYVDWGDVCGGAEYYGPYPSGQEINISHRYTKKIKLIINSLAIDDQGAESNLTYFEVEISRAKASINHNLLKRLIGPFIYFIPLLKYTI